MQEQRHKAARYAERLALRAAHLDGPERAQAEREHLVELLAQAFVDRAAA